MINAERLLRVRRAQGELQRVRDELNLGTALCRSCAAAIVLDEGAKQFHDDLVVVIATLTQWGDHLSGRPPGTDRVSSQN